MQWFYWKWSPSYYKLFIDNTFQTAVVLDEVGFASLDSNNQQVALFHDAHLSLLFSSQSSSTITHLWTPSNPCPPNCCYGVNPSGGNIPAYWWHNHFYSRSVCVCVWKHMCVSICAYIMEVRGCPWVSSSLVLYFDLFYFYIHFYSVILCVFGVSPLCMSVYHVSAVSWEATRGHLISWDWNCRWLWAAMWVLEIKAGSFRRTEPWFQPLLTLWDRVFHLSLGCSNSVSLRDPRVYVSLALGLLAYAWILFFNVDSVDWAQNLILA